MGKVGLNAIIELDSEFGREIGFTSDKFEGYLWLDEDRIVISAIESKHEGRGNLSELFERIWSMGFKVAVPTPMAKMEFILRKKGFKRTEEWFPEADSMCEVWVR